MESVKFSSSEEEVEDSHTQSYDEEEEDYDQEEEKPQPKKQFAFAPKKIAIDISEASKAEALMKHVIKANSTNWKSTFDKKCAKVRYVYCNAPDEDLVETLSKKGKIINRYPGIKGLSHKDSFTRQMNVCVGLNPEAYDFVPPQFQYPDQLEQLSAYMKSHKGCCYIAKPQAGAQGDCIILFRDLKELELKLSCKNKEYVVQRYIDKPMLVKGYKYDLRVYVAVIGGLGDDDMHAFVCDEGLARFCTKKYQAPTKENFKDEFMHLTNYSINKTSENYVWEPEDIMSPNEGSKRTLTALFKQFENEGIDVDAIKESINYSCQGILQMFGNLIQHQVKKSLGKVKPKGQAFQIFGFDILLDRDYKAWVLEVNDHPSFNIFYHKEFMGVKAEDEILSQVDLQVKSKVMRDCLDMVTNDIQEDYESYTCIMPAQDKEHEDIGTAITTIRGLFYKLCSMKDTMKLSSGQFEKMYSYPILKEKGICRANLQLLFQKVSGNNKTIDLIQFVALMKKLHEMIESEPDFVSFLEKLESS